MKYAFLLIGVIMAAALMAADPAGRVTSSGPLTLNGKTVPATAVSSLPLVAGDEICTSGLPAMINFTDNSRATVAPNSRVKLEIVSASLVLRVLSGAMDLKPAAGSRISVIQPIRHAMQAAAVASATSTSTTTATTVTPACPKPPPPSKKCPPHDPFCK